MYVVSYWVKGNVGDIYFGDWCLSGQEKIQHRHSSKHKIFSIIQKAVANTILISGIGNYEHGYICVFTDNIYGYPQLFSIMAYYWNIFAVVTCKYNRNIVDSDTLKLENNCKNWTVILLCDRRLGMVITWWKDYIIVQTFSTVTFKGAGIVT